MSTRTRSNRVCWLLDLSISLIVTLFSLFKVSAEVPSSCNGLTNLCSVKVTDSYFAMVHNAMSAVENGFLIAANHIDDPIVEALDAGYRGLSLDICNCDGNLQLCHGDDIVGCGVGRVDPLQAFTEINNWIDANPNNVIMISLEINEDAGGAISLEMIQEILQQVPGGFSDRLYDQWPIGSEWPTLGELIEANQQVLFFYFQGPDGVGEHVVGLNYWYDSVVATDWQWESVSEIESTLLTDCPLTRGLSSTGDFFLIDAFVTEESFFGVQFLPSRQAAQVINTVEWAGAILDACFGTHGIPATIFSVDFWSEGNLPTLMTQRNSLLVGAPTTTPAPTAQGTMPPTVLVPIPAPSLGSTNIDTLTPSWRPSNTPILWPSSSPSSIPSHQFSNQSFCTVNTTHGDDVEILNGESFGNFVTSSCGDSTEFPCFCRNGLMECPYCAFTTMSGYTYCARHNETISFDDGPVYLSCMCQIPFDPLESPNGSCQESSVPTATPQHDTKLSNSTDAPVEESLASSATTRGFFKQVVAILATLLGMWS